MLFTIAKLWNWPRCPSADERIKKIIYIYIYIYKHTHIYTIEYSSIKKNEIMSFAGK
jgi:hypothetical protein